MPKLTDRIAEFARSPQAKRLAERAQGMARNPETRRKVAAMRQRFAKRR